MRERDALDDQLKAIGRIEQELEDQLTLIELGEAEKDDKTVGEYVRRGLDEAGYHVDLVGDGDEGLRRASGKGAGYDMMVLDLRLPRLSGIDVLRTLR